MLDLRSPASKINFYVTEDIVMNFNCRF